MFPATSYDPETLGVLARAFDDAWADLQALVGPKPVGSTVLRERLARRIMAAADDGERDPARLKMIALGAIDA